MKIRRKHPVRVNHLGSDPIPQLVRRLALPAMLAQFVNVLYSIIDRMYIGNIANVGDIALAGVGICGPIVTMISAFAAWIGNGGAPLLSIKSGEQNKEGASAILANCFVLLIGMAVCLTIGAYLCKDALLVWFGATKRIFPYAEIYMRIYLIGTVFAVLSLGLNQFIICQGFAGQAMLSVVLGAVMNIVLDPVFIYVLDMGVTGAAVATVISQVGSCAFVLAFLFGSKPHVRITFSGYDVRVMRRVLLIGFTPFAIIAVDNVMIIAMNAVLKRYGGAAQGDMLLTCATIAQSFMLVVTMPLGGISSSTQTILSFNYGARRPDRVREAQKRIFVLCAVYTGLMMLVAWTCGGVFARLFTTDAGMADQAVWAIRVCSLALLPLGIQYEIVDGFTALGQVRYSLPLSFWRKLVYFVALFALPAAFGARAAFFAEPVSDVLGPAVSIAVYLLAIRRILQRRGSGPQGV